MKTLELRGCLNAKLGASQKLNHILRAKRVVVMAKILGVKKDKNQERAEASSRFANGLNTHTVGVISQNVTPFLCCKIHTWRVGVWPI